MEDSTDLSKIICGIEPKIKTNSSKTGKKEKKTKRIVLITLVVILSVFIITAGGCAGLDCKTEQSHDVAITNMSASSSCVQGDTLHLIVTVENQGNCSESFDVTLTDVTNGLKIRNQSLTLSAAGEGGMDEVVDRIFTGENIGDHFGNYVCAGDVNGDGYGDILISASRYNNNRGRAYLYYGGEGMMDTQADKVFDGEEDDIYLSEGICLGDVNGDNFADVILGSPLYGSNDEGRVYVFYGAPDMDLTCDLYFDGEPGMTGWFGYPVRAGDVDNDGIDDLLVSARQYDSAKGRAYLYYGGTNMNTDRDKTFIGENSGDLFGQKLVLGEDVNGDNYGDILIGTRHWLSGDGTGRAYLYYGGPVANMDITCDKIFSGENAGDNFGNSVELFDIDNDGYADVLIGARKYNYDVVKGGQGRVYIYWGEADMAVTADLIIDGEENAHPELSSGRIQCGYINNDEYGDIVLPGANYYQAENRGRTYLYYGGPQASMDITFDHTFTGGDAGARPAYVAVADFNGDNFEDFVLGGFAYDSNRGRAYVYYSGADSANDLYFDWDTTGASIGDHILKVEISPVAGEEDTADNTMTKRINIKSKVKEK